MKKFIAILILLISINSIGQDVQGSRIIAKQSFFLRNTWIDSLRRDTINLQNDYGSVPTSAAMYKFVAGRMGGGGGGSGSDTTYTFKNSLYNEGVVVYYDNFSRTYFGSEYSIAFPGTTETISTDGLRLVGNPNNTSNYISRINYTASENFSLKMTYINNSLSAADSGIVIGVRSMNTNCCAHTIWAGVNQATSHPQLGKSYIYGANYSYRSTGANAISSISVGDTIQVELKRNALTYIVNTTNISTGETSTDTVVTTLGLSPTNFFPNNGSWPTIYFFGGDITVIGEEYRLLDQWNADYAFEGNSITQGQAASAYSKTFANRTFESDSGISVITNAGGGDISQYVINRLPELYKLKPRYVVLMVGGNDVFFGVPAATWKANLLTIRDSLVHHGIQVIHLAPPPRGVYDMLSVRNYIDTLTAFQNDIKILATYDSLLGIGTNMKVVYNAGDNVHLTDSGHHYVAILIRRAVTPHPRTPIPTIPLQSLIADGYELPNAVLTNHGWDTIPRPISSSSGGGDVFKVGTPVNNQLGVWTGDGTIEGDTKLTWDGTSLTAQGGFITKQGSSQGSTLIHEDLLGATTLPNVNLRIGNGFNTPGSFSSFGIAPGYSGAVSPTMFFMSNFPGYSGGSTQFMIYQSAAGDYIVTSTGHGFGAQNKIDYYFNTTAYNGFTNASLVLLANGNNGINNTAPNSTLQIGGSLATNYVAKTSTYPITATDDIIECTSGTFTVTLPTAVGITGREYWVVNTGSGTITIATTSSQTFVNVTATPTTLTLAQFTNYRVVSNGANWMAFKIVN